MKQIKIYERIDVENFIKNAPFDKSHYSNDWLKSCGLSSEISKYDNPEHQLAMGHFIDKSNSADLDNLRIAFEKYIKSQESKIAELEKSLREHKARLNETQENQKIISSCKTFKQAFEKLCTK